MRTFSIRFKINLLFFTLFIIVCVLFFTLLRIEKSIQNNENKFRQENLIKNLLHNYTSDLEINIKKYLNTSNFTQIDDEEIIQNVRLKGDIAFRAMGQNCTLSSVNLNQKNYFDVDCESFNALFKAEQNMRIFHFLIFTFLFFLVAIILTYYSVLKSLSPLNRLRKQITMVSENQKFDFSNYKNDEVGKIAHELEKAFKKNTELISSRKLFLRMIMHELKTPIGKGRIISEMLQDLKQKERLIEIFKRLNNLINEFAKIEYLFSKNYDLELQKVHFDELLAYSREFLMNDNFDEVVKINLKKDIEITADIEFFALALKNLIDNALKYSDDKKCEIIVDENEICIMNKGERLNQEINYCFTNFMYQKNRAKGSGFGLYIAHEICVMHEFKLTYHYENKMHIFKIYLKENKNEQS